MSSNRKGFTLIELFSRGSGFGNTPPSMRMHSTV